MKTLSKPTESNMICGICHDIIVDPTKAYQSKFLLIPACSECARTFCEDDLEFMMNMFLAYGGYFGQQPKEDFSLEKVADIIDKIDNTDGNMFEEINLRVMHSAIIHGIPPQEFASQLEELTT